MVKLKNDAFYLIVNYSLKIYYSYYIDNIIMKITLFVILIISTYELSVNISQYRNHIHNPNFT
jgi:hypothetical protein